MSSELLKYSEPVFIFVFMSNDIQIRYITTDFVFYMINIMIKKNKDDNIDSLSAHPVNWFWLRL